MKKMIGLFASVALMGSGMALAQDQATRDTQTQSQSSTGGSGNLGTPQSGSTQQGSDIHTGKSGQLGQSGSQAGQSGSQAGQSGTQMGQSGTQMGQSGMSEQLGGNQLTGRVVKSERRMIWVEHMGAIVPLKIDKNTQFADPSLKRATDFKEGDQVRASFEVRKTDNVATSISKGDLSEGQGGSGPGSDVLAPDQGINQPMDSLPPSGGTGGSGRDDNRGGDINVNEGVSPDSGLNSGDVGTDKGSRTGDY